MIKPKPKKMTWGRLVARAVIVILFVGGALTIAHFFGPGWASVALLALILYKI